MNLTCPCCHATVSLELMAQDEAARDLLALRGQAGALWPHLVAYLGLFRSAKRSLAWSRAFRLAQEVLALDADPGRLAVALAETVEGIRAKRDAGDVRPLTKHNYLLRVLEGLPADAQMLPALAGGVQRPSTRASALDLAAASLQQWAGSDWLAQEISQGLLALYARRLTKAPPANELLPTAGLWLAEHARRFDVQEVDQYRVKSGFKSLLSAIPSGGWWPAPNDLLQHVPRRPDRQRLPGQVDRDAGADAARKARAAIFGEDA